MSSIHPEELIELKDWAKSEGAWPAPSAWIQSAVRKLIAYVEGRLERDRERELNRTATRPAWEELVYELIMAEFDDFDVDGEPEFEQQVRAVAVKIVATLEGRSTEPFLADVALEVARAKGLFPKPDGLMAALTEEVGEVARAVLDETPQRIREECVQVAAMAMRLAEEDDPTLTALRAQRRGE